MRKIVIISAIAVACAAPALAGPKDQGKEAMVGPQALTGNATVNNQTTAASNKNKGCKLQISFKDMTGVVDGDVIICLGEADVISPAGGINPPGGGNSVVLVGEVKSNGVKIKADLSPIGCGGVEALQFNGNMKCYRDDVAYRTGGWMAACTATAGSVPIPDPNCPADCPTLKGDATQPVLVGLCQNFGTLGARINPPPSSLISVNGGRVAIVPP